jgi:autotransporter passenger strand-loop-strand repeat protein
MTQTGAMRRWLLLLVFLVSACGGTSATTAPAASVTAATAPPASQGPVASTDPGQGGETTIDSKVASLDRIVGNVTVVQGGDFTLNGQVTGNVTVQAGGKLNVYGEVDGTVVNQGGDVTIYGQVHKVDDQSGKSVIVSGATVNGSQAP